MISQASLKLFQTAAKDIKAYRRFLAEHNINSTKIDSLEQFTKLPLTSKKNYLVTNKLEDLVWPADQADLLLFCSTSGSTGEPYYFPRTEELGRQYSILVEDFLRNSSYGKGRTLVLNGFGMGVWIGGVLTLRAFEIAGARMKLPLAILPVGYNKAEIFKALRKLSPNFDQTIIIGYPPFIKEIVDEAPAEKIYLNKLNPRFLFAAESFTETFRDYICEKAGVKDPILDTLNIYGTADIGAMAYETPLSILIRRLALQDPFLYRDMFNQVGKTPTFAQYNPEFIEFEEVNNEIILTANDALPLIRYAVGDRGGVTDYKKVEQLMKRYGINLEVEIEKRGLTHKINKKLPFVYVYERTDLSVTLHGLIIYPEFVKEGLISSEMAKVFTEKFTMSTKTDIEHNQFLQVNVELQKGVKASDQLVKKAKAAIIKSLKQKSSEFAEVSKSKSTDKLIQILLWPNGHPRYFTPNTKQKWVEK